MQVITLATPELGDRSYVIYQDGAAIVIDPQRDIDRVLEVVEAHHLQVLYVLDTHLHNDYVSGGLELSQRTGARFLVGGGVEAAYDCEDPQDRQSFQAGVLTVTALRTPGHTVHHTSYLIEAEGETPALFTGGSMLFGTVGRTDLVSKELTDTLTREQYRSTRKLASKTDPKAKVYPTHGFGSFCSSASSSGASESTVAKESVTNIACTTDDEDTFVSQLLQGLTAYPTYYRHMGLLNRAGIASPFQQAEPRSADLNDITHALHNGQWVIDLRHRSDFARQHIKGTIGVEYGNSFTTYLGWIIPWGMPLIALGESMEQILKAQRDLSRIGIDRFDAAAIIDEELLAQANTESYAEVDFEQLANAIDDESSITVVDVRRRDEWEQAHIHGAFHLPLSEILQRADDHPDGELWVHCASGFRASFAASLFARDGRSVVLISDSFHKAEPAGLPIRSR
jgi:glyoxylase-like metal-dependent hydrolase (beta-lactamase superfamily II)/rhodanese-related sulfurtransferase